MKKKHCTSAEKQRLVKRNLKLFPWVVATQNGIALGIPTIVSLWAEAGIGVSAYLALQILFGGTLGLLGIPTGLFADRVGVKNSMLLGAFVHALGVVVYVIADSFVLFALGECLAGIGLAFIRGADETLLYATCRALNQGADEEAIEDQVERQHGRNGAVAFRAMAGMLALGGFCSALHPRLPMILAALTSLGGVLLIALLEQPAGEINPPGWKELRAVVRVLISPKGQKVRTWIVFPSLIASFNQGAFWFYQPLMQIQGMSGGANGAVLAFFNLFAGWSSARQRRRSGKAGMGQFLIPVFTLAGSMVLMGLFSQNVGIVFALLQQWVRGSYQQAVFPARLASSINAAGLRSLQCTVTSVREVILQLCYLPVLFVTRWLFGQLGITGTLSWMALLLLVAGLVLVRGHGSDTEDSAEEGCCESQGTG